MWQDAEEGAGDSTTGAEDMAGTRGDGDSVGGVGTPAAGPGSVGGPCASWVSAVAVCRGTDLVVSPLKSSISLCSVC